MKTRQDYMANRCSHREYYAQFVTEGLRDVVQSMIGIDRIKASTDQSFNDIPLAKWDRIPMPLGTSEKLKKCDDYLTKCGIVCIAKEAAQQIKEAA